MCFDCALKRNGAFLAQKLAPVTQIYLFEELGKTFFKFMVFQQDVEDLLNIAKIGVLKSYRNRIGKKGIVGYPPGFLNKMTVSVGVPRKPPCFQGRCQGDARLLATRNRSIARSLQRDTKKRVLSLLKCDSGDGAFGNLELVLQSTILSPKPNMPVTAAPCCQMRLLVQLP